MKIGIIGGGASGLVAAIKAKNDKNEVIIFERNKECGKKILMTGNGKCNYWNESQSLCHYESSTPDLINQLINEKSEIKILELFNKLGVITKIKNGYYYPFSNQASTIRNVLLDEVKRMKVIIKTEFLVQSIKQLDNKFIIKGNGEEVVVDKIILSTGSLAAPKTGSDGIGLSFLENFHHNIIKPLPALVQLISDGNYLKDWNGIRTDVNISHYENGEFKKKEFGEIQLTNYGVSGICIFNLSNMIAKGLDKKYKENILINFLPFLTDYQQAYDWFIEKTILTNKSVYDLLVSVLNNKLVDVLFKVSKITGNSNFNKLEKSEQEKIINAFINFKVNIIGTKSFMEAQVASGGVTLNEINLNTMESKLVKNLYIIGELLDITGECGGYNLGIAWRTGYLAGISAGENND